MQFQENVVVDLGGFIKSRGVTHASQRESKQVAGLLEGLPLQPVPLAGDTGYSDGRLGYLLEQRDITAYVPIHPRQETSMVASGDFVYHGDHLICPQGKILRRGAYHKRQRSYHYVARQKDCQACPVKDTCLPSGQRRRFFGVSIYHLQYARARERNRASVARRESNRRKTIVEGTFASLDRLGWEKSRLRGLWKVDCEGYMAALAHNVLKMVRRLGRGVGPPGPVAPADAIAEVVRYDTAAFFTALSSCSGWIIGCLSPHATLSVRSHCHFVDFLNGPVRGDLHVRPSPDLMPAWSRLVMIRLKTSWTFTTRSHTPAGDRFLVPNPIQLVHVSVRTVLSTRGERDCIRSE